MTLTIQDLKYFQQQHPDHRLELVGGEIIVMSLSGLESDEITAEIIAQLRNWVRPRRLGRVLASAPDIFSPTPAKMSVPLMPPSSVSIASNAQPTNLRSLSQT